MEKIIITTKDKAEEFELLPMGLEIQTNMIQAKINCGDEEILKGLLNTRTVTHVSGSYTNDYECANIIGITKDVLTCVYTVSFDTDKFSVLKTHFEDEIIELKSQNGLVVDSVLEMSSVIYESEVE